MSLSSTIYNYIHVIYLQNDEIYSDKINQMQFKYLNRSLLNSSHKNISIDLYQHHWNLYAHIHFRNRLCSLRRRYIRHLHRPLDDFHERP